MSELALPRRVPESRIIRVLVLASAGIVLALGIVFASSHVVGALYYVPKLDRLFAELHRDPILIIALRQQNAALAEKDEAWALERDRVWNAERLSGGGPMQTAFMQREASLHLRDIVADSNGLVSHAFLIDAKGRMAAAPFLSYNFWQFNKPKFHYTFPKGANARDVSWLEMSWDGSHPVCWRAETIADPTTRAPIGVIALEVNYLDVGHFGCIEEPAHTAEERRTNRVKGSE
jgi:hypothetical protein